MSRFMGGGRLVKYKWGHCINPKCSLFRKIQRYGKCSSCEQRLQPCRGFGE